MKASRAPQNFKIQIIAVVNNQPGNYFPVIQNYFVSSLPSGCLLLFINDLTMSKNRIFRVVFLLFLLGIGESCEQNSKEPRPEDTAYFPLQVGDYWVYQVMQKKYVSANSLVKNVYQFQEKISSSYFQNGQLFYLVEESMRQTEQTAWKLTGFHSVYKSLSEVVSQENNVLRVKLAFPIALTASWNTNAYNTNSDTLLRYLNPGQSFTVGKFGFAHTISVVGANDSTLVNQSKYLRIYAPNIGLVYREEATLAFCQSSPNCIGKGVIESGTKLKWELIASNRLP